MNHYFPPTLNESEVKQFNQLAEHWWAAKGPFKPLHDINPCRIQFIRDHCLGAFKAEAANAPLSSMPLAGLKILDVGCGGGLLSEPLARLGAAVTGIDASPRAIAIAKQHASESNLKINYEVTTIEKLAPQQFDVVCALEIIEHVNYPREFTKACLQFLSLDGLFFISTLNRTISSYIYGILAAEYILGWLPRGTHDWQKFLTPAELAAYLREENLTFIDLKGFNYNPIYHFYSNTPGDKLSSWSLSKNIGVNYIGCAKRDL